MWSFGDISDFLQNCQNPRACVMVGWNLKAKFRTLIYRSALYKACITWCNLPDGLITRFFTLTKKLELQKTPEPLHLGSCSYFTTPVILSNGQHRRADFSAINPHQIIPGYTWPDDYCVQQNVTAPSPKEAPCMSKPIIRKECWYWTFLQNPGLHSMNRICL